MKSQKVQQCAADNSTVFANAAGLSLLDVKAFSYNICPSALFPAFGIVRIEGPFSRMFGEAETDS